MEERLQKIIARAGVTSRRNAERLVIEGRVSVNGVVESELGTKADAARDEIRVDGLLLNLSAEAVYIMLHKPEGYVTTVKDPEERPTVMELVKRIKSRIYPVGRLDYNSSGLLLLTSDGEAARFLTHPSSEVPKTYEVKVKGRIGLDRIAKLREGPEIGGPPLKPSRVEFLKISGKGQHSWLSMTITEGRSRQIRNMCEAVGNPALKLKRVSLGPLILGDLEAGEWRYLTDREIASLKRLAMKKPGSGAKPSPRKTGVRKKIRPKKS